MDNGMADCAIRIIEDYLNKHRIKYQKNDILLELNRNLGNDTTILEALNSTVEYFIDMESEYGDWQQELEKLKGKVSDVFEKGKNKAKELYKKIKQNQ